MDGYAPAQLALTAVERRGLPCHIERTAEAEGLPMHWIQNACLVIKHAPDLAPAVRAGQMTLWQAARLARLRRDAPDLAARAQARLNGNRGRDSRILAQAWQQMRRYCPNGSRVHGPPNRKVQTALMPGPAPATG